MTRTQEGTPLVFRERNSASETGEGGGGCVSGEALAAENEEGQVNSPTVVPSHASRRLTAESIAVWLTFAMPAFVALRRCCFP